MKQWQQNLMNSSLTYTTAPPPQISVNVPMQAQGGHSHPFIETPMPPPSSIQDNDLSIHFSKRGKIDFRLRL